MQRAFVARSAVAFARERAAESAHAQAARSFCASRRARESREWDVPGMGSRAGQLGHLRRPGLDL